MQLNVNYSTGKLIVRKYKVEGKITMFSYEKDDLSNVRPLQKDILPRKENVESEKSYQQRSDQDQNMNGNYFQWDWIGSNPIMFPQTIPTYTYQMVSPISAFNNALYFYCYQNF